MLQLYKLQLCKLQLCYFYKIRSLPGIKSLKTLKTLSSDVAICPSGDQIKIKVIF